MCSPSMPPWTTRSPGARTTTTATTARSRQGWPVRDPCCAAGSRPRLPGAGTRAGDRGGAVINFRRFRPQRQDRQRHRRAAAGNEILRAPRRAALVGISILVGAASLVLLRRCVPGPLSLGCSSWVAWALGSRVASPDRCVHRRGRAGPVRCAGRQVAAGIPYRSMARDDAGAGRVGWRQCRPRDRALTDGQGHRGCPTACRCCRAGSRSRHAQAGPSSIITRSRQPSLRPCPRPSWHRRQVAPRRPPLWRTGLAWPGAIR